MAFPSLWLSFPLRPSWAKRRLDGHGDTARVWGDSEGLGLTLAIPWGPSFLFPWLFWACGLEVGESPQQTIHCTLV